MSVGRFQKNIWNECDKLLVYLVTLLAILGWLNIYAAVFNESHPFILDLSQKYGKQFLWICGAFIIAVSIIIIDSTLFTSFAYGFYVILLLVNIAVVFLGKDIKGSHSWFRVAGMGIQPAEFMKFAILLAVCKYLTDNPIPLYSPVNRGILYTFWYRWKSIFVCCLLVLIPFVVVKFLQNETGVSVVYFSILLLLYRAGAPIWTVGIAVSMIILFLLSILIENWIILISVLSVPAFLVFLIIPAKIFQRLVIASALLGILSGASYVIKNVYDRLEPHQKNRIEVLLGRSTDVKGIGYNVNQSKIAIGSGGFWGKGYLKGTQTKYNFVPEQETDFIFCTVGEEWGFVGSSLIVILYIFILIRIILMSERQRSDFTRYYGYGLASILFFHILINIGMALGVMPVIGIPLPFFSYGGSSLWGFTILIFIFIRLDAERLFILR